MAFKRLIALAAATFLISVLFSLVVVQSATGTIIDTRKTALIKTLSELQLDRFGAFHFVHAVPSWAYFNELGTARALETLKALNALDKVDINSAVEYIASTQHPKSGGFGTQVDYYGTILGFHLGTTYDVVRTLKETGALSKINRTALINFVMAGYNHPLGAFSALMTEAFAKEYAVSWYFLGFRSWLDQPAYSIPNLISTFFGVSLLMEIDALDLINMTRTLDFIMSARAGNGVFRPYPLAIQDSLPSWSYLFTSPSYVDTKGTGIPYTYAAVSTLRALGRLDVLNQSDRERITEYILGCRSSSGKFYIYKDYYGPDPELDYTQFAFLTLSYIGMQNEATQAILKVQNHILELQQLELDSQWPLPQPSPYYSDPNSYGMFQDDGGDIGDTALAVSILDVTNGLSLLNQFTPRALIILSNVIILSSLITASVLFAVWGFKKIKSRRQNTGLVVSNQQQ